LLAGVAALATAHGLPLGGFQGVGSWIWSLVWLDQLGGDREASGLALQLAAGLDEERLAAHHRLDVEGGLAGLIVALLALHESAGDARALARARQAGDRLLERSEEAHGGLAWRGEIGRPLAGSNPPCTGIGRGVGVRGIAALIGRAGVRRGGRTAGWMPCDEGSCSVASVDGKLSDGGTSVGGVSTPASNGSGSARSATKVGASARVASSPGSSARVASPSSGSKPAPSNTGGSARVASGPPGSTGTGRSATVRSSSPGGIRAQCIAST